MVKTYGRNWKFMADNFLEMRAPLALKNRYSLLMRRLDRQSTGQQQQAGSATPPRHAASFAPSSGSTTPSPNSAVDLTSFFDAGRGLQGQHPAYATMDAASGNFLLSTGPFGADVMPPGDGTVIVGRRGRDGEGTAPWPVTGTTSWDDPNPAIWHPPSFLGGGIEPDGLDNEVEKMTTVSDNGTGGGQRAPPLGGDGSSNALSNAGNGGVAAAAEVEYTVTCRRGKVKTLMNHLMDAAMSESAEWTAEDDSVTISLRLKV